MPAATRMIWNAPHPIASMSRSAYRGALAFVCQKDTHWMLRATFRSTGSLKPRKIYVDESNRRNTYA